MLEAFEQRWARVERAAEPRALELGRRRARRARVRRGARRDRALPVQHLHGDAAGGDQRRRRGRVRRLQPRRPLHVLRGLRAQGRAAQAAGRDPRPHRRPHRLRLRADRRLLPRATGSSCSRTAPTPTAPSGTAAGRAASATPASTRSTRPRRSRPARAACSSRANPELIEFAAQVPQLRQVRARGRRPQLPHERVHRRARPGPGRPDGGDRRLEERVRARAPRPAAPGPARAARRDDLGPLQVHRLRADREVAPGRVYEQPCHRIMGRADDLPNTDWVAENHWCVPLYYRPESREARSARRKHEGPGHRRRRLHRLARRRPADRGGRHAADLRPQRLALPLAARGRDLHRQHHRPRQPRPGDARLRRGHPPRRGRRRRPRPRRPGARRGGQHARHAQRARGRLPGGGRPRRLRLDHLGLQRLRRAGGRRGDADPGAAPPLHRDQAGGGDLLRRLRRALRARVTVLRFGIPYGPRARAAGVVAKFTDLALRRQGADDRRRRQPVPQLHLRRGPRRRASSPRWRRRPPTAPTTSPATRS